MQEVTIYHLYGVTKLLETIISILVNK